tara:strand:+ start:213 stop:1019 length:807 start_codon:yes stop_codon:yes gene_type:complete
METCTVAGCKNEVSKPGFKFCYPCWKKKNPEPEPIDPETLITATKISEHFEQHHGLKISSRKLNIIFNELGWITKPPYDVGGWKATRTGRRNGGVNIPPKGDGSPYVKWAPTTPDNKALLNAVRRMLGVAKVHSEPKQQTFDDENVEPPSKANSMKSSDGHWVRSRGELLIDNYLFGTRIAHAYEQEIYLQDGSKMIPDFMAITPKGNVYIEFWGMEGKSEYDKRREKKKQLYKDNGLELIEIFPQHLDNLDAYLNAVFARYGVKTAF